MAIKKMSNLQKLNALIGVVSGASLGGAIGVSIVRFHFGMYSNVFVVPAILAGATAGFLIAFRSPQELIGDSPGPFRRKVLEAMIAIYHCGAVVVLISLYAWNFDDGGWFNYYDHGHRCLEMLVLGYAFLRFWIFLHSIWSRFIATEPLFFWGLYLGTFPVLVFAMDGQERLAWLQYVLEPVAVVISIPGRANMLFETIFYDYWFRDMSAHILCSSLGWAFLFFILDWFIQRRKTRQPNPCVSGDRDPRERGSRPLNSNR